MRLLADAELVSAYVTQRSEEAFATLVERHVSLVYSSALRQVRNPDLAQEITQAVFVILAHKAASLRRETVLAGWLCRTTHFTACNALKAERRRQQREQEAYMNSLLNEPEPEVWPQIRPLLDEGVAQLDKGDRNAVVLRFYEHKPFEEVGRVLGLNADAAQKRVSRALEKLRKYFVKRGVTLSATLIASAVAANSVQAAPAGLAVTVTATAAKGATFATSIAALVKATMKTMTWLKVKFALGVSAPILAAGGIGMVLASGTNEPPANPALARQVLQAAFAHVSGPLPAQMRFVAEVELEEKPWTEAQIRAEVQRQEDDEHKRYEKIPGLREKDWAQTSPAMREQRRRQQAQLRDIRLESTRTYHNGTRTYLEQEWLSGSSGNLWRLDQLETTLKPEKLQAAHKPLPAGMLYEESHFNIGATNLISHPLSQINHRLRSASFGKTNWKKEAFWEAATLEPSIGFVLVSAASDLMAFARQAQFRPRNDIDSFAGMKLDTNRLEALASGKDGRWIVRTDEAVLNGRKMAVLRLKGKNISLAHGEEIALFADANHLTNIYRIELTQMPLVKTPYVSIRDDFDTNGFPHTWIVETPKAETLKKTVKFKEVAFHAEFDNLAVFSPELPTDYSVNGHLPK